MICLLIQGMACPGSPALIWAYGVFVLIVLGSVLLAFRAKGAGVARTACLAVPAFFSLAALMLMIALERPSWRVAPQGNAAGGQIVMLVDRSGSFWRNRDAANGALSLAAQRIESFAATLPPEEAALWRGGMHGFGMSAAREGTDMVLSNLPGALRNYRVATPEPASNLRAGMQSALAQLKDASGRRMVIILTDAQTAVPPGEDLLDDFRVAGIEIHFIGAGAVAPSAGLVAANLGPEQRLGSRVVLRGSVLGGGGLTLEGGDGLESRLDVSDSPYLRAVRLETRFLQRGLQGVRLDFSSEAGDQSRALFTLVRGPARLLIYGAAPWADSLPPARWHVERGDPTDPQDPEAFDLVAIDALSPEAFGQGYPERLLAAMDGTGLFLINGAQRGAVDQEQVISEWNRTALKPVLPVDSDPRLFVQEPPPRDIVIMVDVSGSMGGVRLGSAKSAINAIIDQLRSQDSVAILPFASGAMRGFAQATATPAAIEAARRFTAGLTASGGTSPESTIRDSARFASNYCAFFFISDADFAPPSTAPQCFTTAISVSNQDFPMDMARWGEQLKIGEGGDGRNIRLSYFEPEEREEYFRPGSFRPLVADNHRDLDAGVGVDGLAIAYPRADAQIGLFHPDPPPDPLFSWRRDARRTGVVTGVFLGKMGAEWGISGLSALERMLGLMLGWSDQDRHLIRLTEAGTGFRLSLTALHDQSSLGLLSASVIGTDGASRAVPLRFDPRTGAHTGIFVPPAGNGRARALLVLQEGSDVQRIPLVIPAVGGGRSSGREDFDFGVNSQLVDEIIDATEGNDLERDEIGFYGSPVVVRHLPLSHYFLALAILFIAAAVWSRELGRN
jgi:hypothetical protein